MALRRRARLATSAPSAAPAAPRLFRGIAIAPMMPMITITITSSIRLKARSRRVAAIMFGLSEITGLRMRDVTTVGSLGAIDRAGRALDGAARKLLRLVLAGGAGGGRGELERERARWAPKLDRALLLADGGDGAALE